MLRDGHAMLAGAPATKMEAIDRQDTERFRLLANHLSGVFWTMEIPGPRITYVSPAFELLWEWIGNRSTQTERCGWRQSIATMSTGSWPRSRRWSRLDASMSNTSSAVAALFEIRYQQHGVAPRGMGG